MMPDHPQDTSGAPHDPFRAPRLGDVIRTTKPLNCDSLLHRAGDYMHAILSTPESVEEARHLVASRRWCVVERKQESGRAATQ